MEINPKPEVVAVLLPIPTDRPYSYAVPDGMQLAPGDIVQVPLGPRKIAAAVWDSALENVDPAKLRQIEHKFDCPPLSSSLRRFIDWVADYCMAPPGTVLKMVLRAPGGFDPPAPAFGFRYVDSADPERLTKARKAVLELARNGNVWTKSGLAHAAGVSPSVVDGLAKLGSLVNAQLPREPLVATPDPNAKPVELTPDQASAAQSLRETVYEGGYSTTLIDGVTGAGKTEVYFEAIAATLEAGRQVLILLPEIALTASFLDRFEDRFGARPAQWHSEIGPKKRDLCWRQAATGEIRVVAGARSSLFLPFSELGLIIVDEEHDSAYKQEDRVFYNARDMAVIRANLGGFPIVLASATPSIESRVNAEQGRYRHIQLPMRYADAQMPKLTTIDMRRNPPARGGFISPPLIGAVEETIARGEQAMLFLNRRGYAPLTLCRVCGHRFQCNNCSAWLVEHRFRRQLMCHHCGHAEPVPEACPNCGTLDHLVACGPGVERLGEEVLERFPEARTIVLSSDMMGGVTRLRLELEAIANGEADIVIGTQLVAKGHNFPNLTCVGVIDADLGLANGDPRAAERTFQLLSQVTGRAGRSGHESQGYLQSYQPDHPVIAAIISADPEAFYEREIEARRNTALPPFGRLISVIVSATDRTTAENHAKALRRAAPAGQSDVSILGPAEAPLSLVRGRYRFRLLIHGPRHSQMQDWIREMIAKAPRERGNIKVQIDVDPQSFL